MGGYNLRIIKNSLPFEQSESSSKFLEVYVLRNV